MYESRFMCLQSEDEACRGDESPAQYGVLTITEQNSSDTLHLICFVPCARFLHGVSRDSMLTNIHVSLNCYRAPPI